MTSDAKPTDADAPPAASERTEDATQPFSGLGREESVMVDSATLGTVPDADARSVETSYDDEYPALYRSAYRVAFRLLGRREEAADLAQEACARAYARWNRIGKFDSPEAWVAKVAGNLAIDARRRANTAQRHVDSYVAPRTQDEALEAERLDLHRALLTLPRRQREVVLLRFVADQPEAAVAAALGCSLGTVKSHASRGLAALRDALGREVV
jgi:RNA polymerase sigma-70 factor (ECF subfamily)